MKTIAIANQKGGTAKTTTTAALAVVLSRSGTPVHMIDMDPQASLTRAFGASDDSDGLYNALASRARLPLQTVSQNLSLTSATIELGRAETELLAEPGREFFLKTCLQRTPLPENAVVFLDCPPSLGVLSVNCLASAGGMIAVVQPGGFELHTLVHLHMTVQAIQERVVNPDLHILGVVVTNAHRRRKITEQVRLEASRLYPLLGTVRSDARLLYATTAGLIHRLTSSKAMNDYADVLAQLGGVLP
jgi:chromosome partitioning protein